MAGPGRIALVLVALCVALQGCFRARLNLEFHPDGKLSAHMQIILPRVKGLKVKVPQLLHPLVAYTTRVWDSQLLVSQQALARSLGRLRIRWARVCVAKTDIGLIGTHKATYEVVVVFEPGQMKARWAGGCRQLPLGPAPRVPGAQVMEAWRVGLGKGWVEVGLKVPGRVVWAQGQRVCTSHVEPVVEGAVVRWRIPLADLLGCRWERPVVLRARFVGRFGLGGPKGSYMRSRPWSSSPYKP